MAIFNEETTLIALNEKKTREEYARRSFKKKYNFEPDEPGSAKGTIRDKDGKKYKVNTDPGNVGYGIRVHVPTSAEIMGDAKDSNINLDKNYFKLKGSHKGERRDAVLQHEIGHQRLHNTDADNKTVDKKNRTMEVYKNVVRGVTKDNSNLDVADDNAIKSVGANPHDVRKAVYDQNDAAKKYAKTVGSKEDRKRRNADLETAKRFEKNAPHANAYEFEADRYAANKTSEKALKRGVRNATKLSRKDYDKTYNMLTMGYGDEEGRKKFKKDSNKAIDIDSRQRSKALKDPDMRKAKTYK